MPPAAADARPTSSLHLPSVSYNHGAQEALKWIALIVMTGDHINKYLLGAQVPALFAAGRVAFPIFAFVLASNLAKESSLESGAYARTAKRLAVFGVLAGIPFISLGGLVAGWWPLNIMATFLVTVAIMYLNDRGGVQRAFAAGVLFVVGGLVVEYSWPGIAMTLAAWRYARRPSAGALFTWVAATAAVAAIPWLLARVPMSLNLWALAALPIIGLVMTAPLQVPRVRWIFYAYYPIHLAVIWLLQNIIEGK